MNDIVHALVEEETGALKGKKLLAESGESYSMYDIDNMIKQTFSTQTHHENVNKNLQKFFTQWQLFFHGNTHVTNWNFMLNSLQNKSPQFAGYEPSTTLLQTKAKSFRQYYTQKAEKFKEPEGGLGSDDHDDLRYPLIHKYWDISLD